MKFGVCRGLDDFEAMKYASEAGVDYLETGFGCLADFSDDKFAECKDFLRDISLECTASNGFIPGHMKLVGDHIDYAELSEYIERGFMRAEDLGVKTVVLGSGKARSFDEGFSAEKAKEQLAFFLSEYAAPRAEKAGAIIVIEPLRFCESTMVYTVADAIEIAGMSGADNVKALADLYHVYGNDDIFDSFEKNTVCHAHIAQPITRKYPSAKDDDDIKAIYTSFIEALKQCGCATCSVEARTEDFNTDIFDAVKLLKGIIC